MFEYAATPLPTKSRPKPGVLTKGTANTISEARNLLSRGLMNKGVPGQAAVHVANGVESTWTDFPEYGVTAYIRP